MVVRSKAAIEAGIDIALLTGRQRYVFGIRRTDVPFGGRGMNYGYKSIKRSQWH